MITKFDSSYIGTIDLENPGYAGTPINDRSYSNEELAGVLHKAVDYAKCMDVKLCHRAYQRAENNILIIRVAALEMKIGDVKPARRHVTGLAD